MAPFSKKEALAFGRSVTKQNFGFLIGLMLLASVIQFVPAFLAELARGKSALLSSLLGIISWLVQMVISFGMLNVALKFAGGAKAQLSDLFGVSGLLIPYLFASILYALIILGGTLLLVVPGIIWSIQYQFYGYAVIDKHMGPMEAIKYSSSLTKGSKWNLFLFGLLATGVMLLGVLCFLVGIFAAMPVIMIAHAYIYKKLSESSVSTVPAGT